MKAILYKDGIEQRRAEYPDLEIKAIDLPSGYEWKLLIEGVKPNFTELERLERTEVDNNISNSDYPHLKQIDIVYTKVRKSDDVIIGMIENAENNANEQLINHIDRLKVMVLYMALVHRKLNGDTITPKMQVILDKGDVYATKLWQNDTNLSNKLQELANNQDPNINTGWTNE